MGNNLSDMCGPAITEEEKKELTYIGFTEKEIKELKMDCRPIFLSPKPIYRMKSRSKYPKYEK